MARGRNRNNQGANRNNQRDNRPDNVDEATDAEFLENDEQVDSEFSDIEEQATMAKEPSQQDDNEVDEFSSIHEGQIEEHVVSDEAKEDSVAADKAVSKKKGNNAVWYGVGAVLIAAAVAGVYYSNQSDGSANNPSTTSQTVTGAETPATEPVDPEAPEGTVPATALDESEEEQSVSSESTTDEAATTEETAEGSDDGSELASSDEVVEHQTGEEVTDEEQEPESSASQAVDEEPTVAEESSTADERPAEQSAIVSPELGIGAFEQEELATGEQTPEDATSMDEPNAEMIEVDEVKESEDVLIDVPSEDETAPVANEADAFTDEVATEVDQEPEATEATDEVAQPEAEEPLQAQTEAIAAVEEQGNKIIEELEREFEVLAARQQQEIRRLQAELSGMQQHLEANNDSVDGLLLNDVSRLLQSAENELRFNGNVANAVSILTVAQRIAAESKNTMLEGLVGAIGADIVALKSSESATIEDMFRQVQQLSRLIDAAPLKTPDYASHTNLILPNEATEGSTTTAPQEAEAKTTAEGAKWYERTWNQTKSLANTTYSAIASDLGDLVRVEKLSEPDSGLLSAEQAGIMRNNLKMQLGFAQQALMSRQQGIWQTSLMTVADSLEQYFRPDAPETKQAQVMLAELAKSSVQPAMPDISHSRRALSETYEQLRVQRSFQE